MTFLDWLAAEPTSEHHAVDFATFTRSWAGALWNELYRIDLQACQWAEATALVSFTGSSFLDENTEVPVPPVTYIERLQASKVARQKALSRALADVDRWQSVRVLGDIGRDGYPAVYLGLYCSSTPGQRAFQPVLDAHTNNCQIATDYAHQCEDAAKIQRSPTHRSRLIHALGQRVPALASSGPVSAEPRAKQKLATALHAAAVRPYSFGQSN